MKEKHTVFITRKIPSIAFDLLKENHIKIDLWEKDSPPLKEDLIQRSKKANALLAMVSDPLDKDFFESCSHLLVISNYAVGINNIDIPLATRLQIPIGNTPDVLTDATADLALALLLSLSRNIIPALKNAKEGHWNKWEPLGFLGTALQGKNLGIIGMGRIGQAFAKKAHFALGMNILYHSRKSLPKMDDLYQTQMCSLEELLTTSDVISLHCPLNTKTRHLMNRKAFKMMKKSSYFINTSRGEVIDQEALYQTLKSKTIKAAALDVTTPEPLPSTDQLFSLDNILITPHIASATQEARDQMAILAAKNIISGLKGQKPVHCVNPEIFH